MQTVEVYQALAEKERRNEVIEMDDECELCQSSKYLTFELKQRLYLCLSELTLFSSSAVQHCHSDATFEQAAEVQQCKQAVNPQSTIVCNQ